MSEVLFQSLAEAVATAPVACRWLIGLDYDGTLTPIVADPRQAFLASEVRASLKRLAAQPHTHVAIISGRALPEVQALVDLQELTYAGNHGLEIVDADLVFVEPQALSLQPRLHALADELATRCRDFLGVNVEDKGLTLSVHYRQASPATIAELIRHLEDLLVNAPFPLRVTHGQKVYEIRPAVDWHKGRALTWLRDRYAADIVVYVGDDQTDEDAFAAIPTGLTVRVGTATTTYARFSVPGPTEVHHLIELLATRQ